MPIPSAFLWEEDTRTAVCENTIFFEFFFWKWKKGRPDDFNRPPEACGPAKVFLKKQKKNKTKSSWNKKDSNQSIAKDCSLIFVVNKNFK